MFHLIIGDTGPPYTVSVWVHECENEVVNASIGGFRVGI